MSDKLKDAFADAIASGVPEISLLSAVAALKGMALAKASIARRAEIAKEVLDAFYASSDVQPLLKSIAEGLNAADDFNGTKPVDPKKIVIYRPENDAFVIPHTIDDYISSPLSCDDLFILKKQVEASFKSIRKEVISKHATLAPTEIPGEGLQTSVPEGAWHTVLKDGSVKVTIELKV